MNRHTSADGERASAAVRGPEHALGLGECVVDRQGGAVASGGAEGVLAEPRDELRLDGVGQPPLVREERRAEGVTMADGGAEEPLPGVRTTSFQSGVRPADTWVRGSTRGPEEGGSRRWCTSTPKP